MVAVCRDERGEGVGVQQRDVTGRDHDDAAELPGQCRKPAQRGMAGAHLLFLDRDLDRAPELCREVRHGGRDAVAVLAEHHHQMFGRHLGDGVQGMRDHAAAAQGVQHLGGVGAHPGAGPGGEHQNGRLGVRRHPGPPPVCGFPRDPPRRRGKPHSRGELPLGKPRSLPMVARQASLRRQDSNLNYLNQNQRCCRLHHGGWFAEDSNAGRLGWWVWQHRIVSTGRRGRG